MAKVTFEVPDDFVPMKGVCVLSGWKEGDPPKLFLYRAYLPDTAEWEANGLYREGLRKSEMDMIKIWSDIS